VDFSLTHSNAVNDVRSTTTTFERQWKRHWNLAMLWVRPHVRMYRTSSTVFDGVRPPSISVDRGWPHQFERYWNLSMLDFWYTFKCCRRLWIGWHSNVCERVRRRKWERYINFGLLNTAYHIDRDILCSIVSYPLFFLWPYRAITIDHLFQNIQQHKSHVNYILESKLFTSCCLIVVGWLVCLCLHE